MKHEARIIAGLCHPYLPYLFTKKQPCRIVMQFHGVVDHSYPFSITFHCEFHHRKLGLSALEWVVACGQLLEAVSHLTIKYCITISKVTTLLLESHWNRAVDILPNPSLSPQV